MYTTMATKFTFDEASTSPEGSLQLKAMSSKLSFGILSRAFPSGSFARTLGKKPSSKPSTPTASSAPLSRPESTNLTYSSGGNLPHLRKGVTGVPEKPPSRATTPQPFAIVDESEKIRLPASATARAESNVPQVSYLNVVNRFPSNKGKKEAAQVDDGKSILYDSLLQQINRMPAEEAPESKPESQRLSFEMLSQYPVTTSSSNAQTLRQLEQRAEKSGDSVLNSTKSAMMGSSYTSGANLPHLHRGVTGLPPKPPSSTTVPDPFPIVDEFQAWSEGSTRWTTQKKGSQAQRAQVVEKVDSPGPITHIPFSSFASQSPKTPTHEGFEATL